MKVLIIGGTGNISTPISKWLQEEHELTLFNHDKSRPDWLNSGVQVISGDRKDYDDFAGKLSSVGRFDCVIDMIAFEPEDAQADVRIFAHKTEQFIFCSTVDVYPKDAKRYPVSEEDEIGASATFPYAYKKVQCERTLWAAHDRGDFNLTVIRPSFTYNETWSPGIHSFGGQSYHLDRLIKGKPVILHGDGLGIWVATYRDDTARAFVGAVGNAKTYGQAYNVTGDEWMTHNHIWRTIARVLGAPEPQFIYIPTEVLGKIAPREAEWCMENFRYNNIFINDKAKRDLGYRYTVSFEQGAGKCIRYLTEHKLIEDSAHYPFYDRIIDQWKKCEQLLISDHEQAI